MDPDATAYVNRLVSRLKLDTAVGAEAVRLYEAASLEWAAFYREDALGAAAVYVAATVCGADCSQPKLARVSAVPDRVLDRHVAHLLAYADVPLAP